MPAKIKLSGGCHCRAIRFVVETAADATVQACNCSICAMTGYLHLIVPKDCFELISGGEKLQTYRFNTGAAQHLFCGNCGIKSFYVPRSNPDGYSVNVRCLDAGDTADFRIERFDGQNWEDHAGSLRHLSSG